MISGTRMPRLCHDPSATDAPATSVGLGTTDVDEVPATVVVAVSELGGVFGAVPGTGAVLGAGAVAGFEVVVVGRVSPGFDPVVFDVVAVEAAVEAGVAKAVLVGVVVVKVVVVVEVAALEVVVVDVVVVDVVATVGGALGSVGPVTLGLPMNSKCIPSVIGKLPPQANPLRRNTSTMRMSIVGTLP